VTSAMLYDEYDLDERLNLEEWNQYFAFSVQDFYTKEAKDDPNFVQWTPMIV
jgi:hypothetical protein